MPTAKRMFIIILLVLNAIVLLGQIWPEGAPSFAHIVNIITLGLNVSFLLTLIKGPGNRTH
ncbi:MAG: hypothetical protein IPL92_19030 [Saprospiraceae bacterium]|nr:hypothetical protein [Candidatus Opimibacter iunctus]